MGAINRIVLKQSVSFFLALVIFNMSVDVSDGFLRYSSNEDLAVNDQETVVEWILETALGFDDAVSETDDPDCQQETTVSIKKVDIADEYIHVHSVEVYARSSVFVYPEADKIRATEEADVNAPPPKV